MSRKERRAIKSQERRQTHTVASPNILNDAIALHQAGKLAEGETLYRQILAANPNHPDALHLLGVICLQTGDYQAAIAWIGKAIEVQKNTPAFHYSIGNAYVALGKNDEAQTHYEKTITLNPNFAEAHNNLGYIHLQQAHTEKAVPLFNKAITLKPDYADALNNLGLALKDKGKLNEALACFDKALTIRPNYAQALNNKGMILRKLGKPDEAVTFYEQALALDPRYGEAQNNLGNVLRDIGKIDEAQAQFERLLAASPQYAEAHSNLGNALRDLGKYDEAIDHYKRALAIKPDFAVAYFNIGNVCQERGLHDEALANYDSAIALQSDYGDALWNRSMLHLLKGDFERGWKEYERRWLKNDMGYHGYAKPLWNGSNLDGKTILLHCEQGLGDSLQFVRYAPLVKQRGGRVLLVCPPTLATMFKSVEGIDQIIPQGQPVPDHDCQSPLLSLPLLFNTTLETIPSEVPYLAAPQSQVDFWAERLLPYSGYKVGLVWAGNPRKHSADANAVDRRRSMNLEHFASLATIPGITLFSLQKGEPAAQIKNPPRGMRIIDFMDDITDYTGTAALIANLDLVIGVDTSVIHMAGALGKPVWMLSRFDGCWRWLLDRDDSPWYPTMRIFRQSKAGDWGTVVEKVRLALSDLPAAR